MGFRLHAAENLEHGYEDPPLWELALGVALAGHAGEDAQFGENEHGEVNG
jgi:hypothetical protein